MSYTPTAYYYIFYRNKKDYSQKVEKFLNFFNEQSFLDVKKKDTLIEVSNKIQSQIIVNSINGEDTYTIFDESWLYCIEMELESDSKNTSLENYSFIKKNVSDLLNDKVIDLAKLYSPEEKGRVFHYLAFKNPLLLYLIQMKYMKEINKYNDEYKILIDKFFEEKFEPEIIEICSKEKYEFLNENLSSELMEFLELLN